MGSILIKTLCISINVRLLLVQSVENFFDKGLLVVNKSSYCIKKKKNSQLIYHRPVFITMIKLKLP